MFWMKIMERVLEKRLRQLVIIDEMQCGFMPGKGTMNALFIVRMLQEKYAGKKKKLYVFYGFEKGL